MNNKLSKQDVKNANAMTNQMNDIINLHSPQKERKNKGKNIADEVKEQLNRILKGFKKG